MEQELKNVKNENDVLKKALEESQAEKIALDQMYVECLKSLIQSKKQVVLHESEIKKLKDQSLIMIQEKQSLKDALEKAQNPEYIPSSDI